MGPRKFVDLGHFSLCDLPCVDAAYALAARMHMQHDLRGALAIQGKERFQNHDNEVHGREVVIEDHHLVHRRLCHLGWRDLHGGAVMVIVFVLRILRHDFDERSILLTSIGCADGCSRANCASAVNFRHMTIDQLQSNTLESEPRIWCPRVTVATVVPKDGRYLLVEEHVHGRTVINQPAGHLEPDESLQSAAVRETLEETGWDVELDCLIGVQQWTSSHSGSQFVRFTFAANPLSHDPSRPLDKGILRALWMDRDEIVAASDRLRSPLILHSIDDWLAGRRLPVDSISQLARGTLSI